MLTYFLAPYLLIPFWGEKNDSPAVVPSDYYGITLLLFSTPPKKELTYFSTPYSNVKKAY